MTCGAGRLVGRGRTTGAAALGHEVAVVEPDGFLGLHGLTDLRGHLLDPEDPRPSVCREGLWGFRLDEAPGGGTRLVTSGYQALRPRWLERFLFGGLFAPLVWPMAARMPAVLEGTSNVRAAGARPRPRVGPCRPRR
jgi:hypothetical protein